jgi:signal recognition particle subunit SRP19
MPLDEDKAWVLWPEYFDSARTRAQGRKVPRGLAIPEPTLDALAAALKRQGLQFKLEPEKAYPGNWFNKKGRALVERSQPKTLLVLKTAEALRAQKR